MYSRVAELIHISAQKLDPEDRPTIDSIKGDPFFAEFNFNSMWTDVMPIATTGIKAPAKAVDHTASIDKAFDAIMDPGSSDDGIRSASDVEGEIASSPAMVSPTKERRSPMFQFPREDDLLREPQRKWIEAGANSFSSSDSVEKTAIKKAIKADSGDLTRKITHQWEQEERRKQW